MVIPKKRERGLVGPGVPALGMGCWAIGGEWELAGEPAGWGKTDERESEAAVRAAFEAGIRLFDTAANYGAGRSERILGRVLGDVRDQCLLVTKFGFLVDEARGQVRWPSREDDAASRVAAECEASLRRLGTDRIDLYLFHQWDHDPDSSLVLRGALEDLVRQGKIRAYGWSTDNPKLGALFAAGPSCGALEFTANVVQPNPAMTELCSVEGLRGLVKSPLAMGFLSGKYTSATEFAEGDVRRGDWARETFQKPVAARLGALREVLTSGGRTLVQGSLAWLWAQGDSIIPIPGIRTPAQARENAGALEFGPLTPAQVEEIRVIVGKPD